MNRYDRNRSQKYNRFPIIILLLLIGASWINNLYDDVKWVRSENNTFKEIISNKDVQILSLIKILDSLTYKPKDLIIREEMKPKLYKKVDTITKGINKDTVTKNLVTKTDSI